MIIKFIASFFVFVTFSFSQSIKMDVIAKDSSFVRNESIPISDTVLIEEMNFKTADIRDVLRGIASQYNLNIWLAPEVEGKIPISFKKIPVRTALDFIITKYGYNYIVKNGIIEVSRPVVPPLPPPPKPLIQCDVTFESGKLNVDVKDIPADTLVRILTQVSGRNIILENTITSKITGLIKDIDFDKGLTVLFENNGLEFVKKNDMYFINKPMWTSNGKDAKQSRQKLAISVDSGKVKLEVSDADLSDVINIISSRAGISIFIYGRIEGKVTAKLESYIEIENALKFLLNNTSYTFWKEKDIYFLGDKNVKAVNNGELVKLRYMKAEEVLKLLPEGITQNTKVKLVKEQNGLLFLGTYDYISSAKDFISIVDQPIAQILIEALVVDFSVNKIRDLGIKLFTGDGKGGPANNSFFPTIDVTATGSDFQKSSGKKLSDYFTLEQITHLPVNFRAQVSALEQQGLANVISTPQIATLNGNNATILIGSTQYFLLSTTTTSPGTPPVVNTSEHFEKIDADVTLSVTPWVTGENEVTVEINPVFHILGASIETKIPPPINKREIKSVVRLKDGETYILGGLIEDSERKTTKGVPFLSSIPIVGWFFKSTRIEHAKNRMMIFLTPHIYYGDEGRVDKDEAIKSLR